MRTPGDVLKAVEELGPVASARAAETETLRRLPDDIAAALTASGIFRLWVPNAYGGVQADVHALLDAVEALAYHDGATGWCGMIGATTALTSGFLPAEFAQQIYGDEHSVTGGYAMPAARAVPVDGGGLRVTGQWQWGSGSYHCTWLCGGALVVGPDGRPAPRPDGLAAPIVFLERGEYELLDTWHVAGLKGTGSTDYTATDVFVPEGRWIQLPAAEPTIDAPLYRFPFAGALALGVSSVALGLARRAWDELVDLAGGKRPAQSSRSLAERPVTQADVARAEAAFRSARAFVRDVVDEAWSAAEAGDPLSAEHRRSLRLAATDATWRAVGAVDLAYHAGGGSSIHESSPLQRVFRDVHVASQHGMVAARVYEPLGRMALGLPTDPAQL